MNDFELDEAKGAAIANVANAIGRDLATVFKERHTPTDEYDGEQRQVSAPLCGSQTKVTIPCYGHETIGDNEQKYCPETFHLYAVVFTVVTQ